MTLDNVYQEVGTVQLNGDRYKLVRNKEGVAYSRDYEPEPPYDQGMPRLLSEQQYTWHLGGFKSRQGIPGTSEYGVNSDGRWPFRLVPGPYINTMVLPGNASAIRWIWTTPALIGADPLVWITAGGNAYVSVSDVLGQPIFSGYTYNPIMGLRWQGYYLITDSNSQLWKGSVAFNLNRLPTGAGASTQWTPSAGANWQNVDENSGASDADATYNSDSVAGHIDLFTKTALAGPAVPDTIYQASILAEIRRTATGGTNPVMRGVVRIGAVNYFGSPVTLANDTAYHIVTLGTWTVSPATGVAWTIAELDAAQFGYELQTAPGAGVIRVTQTNMDVEYVNWATTDAKAYWLAAGPKRLFKVWLNASGDIELKNLETGLDPTVEANWADQVIVPGQTITECVPPLVAYQRTAIVATNTGAYGVDEDGTGTKIYERLEASPHTMAVQDPWLYLSHSHGLSRWLPGLVQDCGLEQEILNSGPITGVVKAVAFIGPWIFAALHPPGLDAQVIVGRERRANEQGVGPLIWDTLIDTGVDEDVTALRSSLLVNEFGLGFEKNNDLGYVIFPETGGVPDIDDADYRFVLSAQRTSVTYRFDTWQDKNLYRVRAKGRGLSANIHWDLSYQVDGASPVTTDIGGNPMSLVDDDLHEFVIAASAQGMEFKAIWDYTSNDNTAKGEVVYYEPLFAPVADRIPTLTILLRLLAGQMYDTTRETRSAEEQRDDLVDLLTAGPVTATGPWGTKTFSITAVQVQSTTQQARGEYSYIAQVTMQERET